MLARLAVLLALFAPLVPGAGASPGQPLMLVRGNEVLMRAPVSALAADGQQVGFAFCNQLVALWQPAKGVTPLGPKASFACPPPVGAAHVLSIAVADGRVSWAIDTGGNTVDDIVLSAATARPGAVATVAQVVHCCRADPSDLPDQDRLGDVYGHGNLAVYASRQKCGDSGAPACTAGEKPAVVSSTIWRLGSPSAQPRSLLTSSQWLEPISVAGGRVALQRADGAITVVNASGRLVRAFASLAGRALRGGVLDGQKLIVLVPGKLLAFDVVGGRQLAARRLPKVSAAGPCGLPPCPTVSLRLLDASHGLVAYLLAGKLHLLRLRDGRDAAVAGASDARFAAAGLVYAYQAAGQWAGRVRLIPWAKLPLAP